MAIDRCNPTYLLIIGSPLGPEGVFYSIECDPRMHSSFVHFKLTKFDCLQENGWWLNRKDIDDLVNRWGKEHPLILSSVYAEFATNIEGGIISLSDIERLH